MNIKQLLKESLTDIPSTNQLLHYTNSDSLSKILESGYLKANDNYPAKTIERKNVSEIAVMRPTKDNELNAIKGMDTYGYNKKLENLSVNIGNIKIILFKDRITKGVRGASIKPIAELPKNEIKGIEKVKEEFISKYSKGRFRDEYKGLRKDLDRFIRSKTATEQARQYEMLNIKYKQTKYSEFNYINKSLKDLRTYLKPEEKEGEERIVFKYNDGKIPLNDNLMRIELLPGCLAEINLTSTLARGMAKYDSLFVDNAIYRKLKKQVKEIYHSYEEADIKSKNGVI